MQDNNYFSGQKVNINDVSNVDAEDHLVQNYIERQLIDNPNAIKPVSIDTTNSRGIYIFVISDVHIASRGANLLKLLRHMKQLQPLDNVYYILNGDLMNNAIPGSVSSQLKDLANPEETQKILIKIFKKYLPKDRNRVAIFGTGNHEDRTPNVAGINPLKTVATALDIYHRFADLMYLIDFNIQSVDGKATKKYRVFGRHGSGGGSSVGVALDKIFGLYKVFQDFDLAIEGHLHKNGQATKCYNAITDDGIKTKVVNAVTANAYQEYGDYAARIALPPSDTDNFLYEINLVKNPNYELAPRSQRSKHEKYVFNLNTHCMDKFLLKYGEQISQGDLNAELDQMYNEVNALDDIDELTKCVKELTADALTSISNILNDVAIQTLTPKKENSNDENVEDK